MNPPAHVLYLSYDGMTDPLGQSQVLPYVFGLAKAGYRFTLISFEKPNRLAELGDSIHQQCQDAGVRWLPQPYTKRPPVFSTLWDILRMGRVARKVFREDTYQLVHCRSYLASLVGLGLKRQFGVKFLFDMRGFWADERVEGGLWNLKNPLYKAVYQFFKRKEQAFVWEADGIISLTEAGKKVIESWPAHAARRAPITVIPCSADYQLFRPSTLEEKTSARQALGIPESAFVVSSLGSVGTWYLLAEQLLFFKAVIARDPEAKFLFLTAEAPSIIFAHTETIGVPLQSLIIRKAARHEVSFLIGAADVSLCFIKPSFSKLASSPTKLGELLAKGIPVLANAGVGDVAEQLAATGGGRLLESTSVEALTAAAHNPGAWQSNPPATVRELARPLYDLAQALDRYQGVYAQL